MAYKENRTVKVYEKMTERKDQNSIYAHAKRTITVPQIRLEGLWLEELGFRPGTQMNIHCENGKLTITAAE